MAGYSNRSLVEKLGIKPGHRIIILNSPLDYPEILGMLPPGSVASDRLEGTFDFIQLFTKERKGLEKIFADLKRALSQTGMLWISWPKRSSGIETDLNENIIREIGLDNGLVDVKVCAVDEIWSGLKFVFRLKDRK
jgi:hypothetical protein